MVTFSLVMHMIWALHIVNYCNTIFVPLCQLKQMIHYVADVILIVSKAVVDVDTVVDGTVVVDVDAVM